MKWKDTLNATRVFTFCRMALVFVYIMAEHTGTLPLHNCVTHRKNSLITFFLRGGSHFFGVGERFDFRRWIGTNKSSVAIRRRDLRMMLLEDEWKKRAQRGIRKCQLFNAFDLAHQ